VAPGSSRAPEWPAPAEALTAARAFLREAAAGRVVVACDRDVDGLTAGLLVARTLERLGGAVPALAPAGKGEHAHAPAMRARLAALSPTHLVVVDMGSRAGEILRGVPTLVVDHHQPRGFPDGAVALSAFGVEPVAPTSLLAYELCRELAPIDDLVWLALLGAVADLGTELPFAELARALPTYGRKAVTESVALLNAARRAEGHDTETALGVLSRARSPREIARGELPGVDELRRCRREVQAELGRCGRVAPRFAGPYALVRFSSPTQIHPLLAARWARRLRRNVAIAANDGYLPGRVNFSMRTALDVNLVDLLRGIALPGAVGDWGFGHPRATGGSLAADDFARLLAALGFEEAAGAAPPAPA
jgi:single-stranded DNA-specific DHH superfamily exonuclease